MNPCPVFLNVPEIHQFLNYHAEWPTFRKWRPFRTELRVFDRALEIPGSVDMLYWSPRSTKENPLLILVDWKRSKEIKMKSFYNRANGGFTTFTTATEKQLIHFGCFPANLRNWDANIVTALALGTLDYYEVYAENSAGNRITEILRIDLQRKKLNF